MGVRRAVSLALDAALSAPRVCVLGHLIHNPQALESLRERGIETIEHENELPRSLNDTAVIIRAHGIQPEVERRLERRGARMVDATCPRVKQSQIRARTLSEAGYQVFLAGEKQHGEVAGIHGYAPDCFIVENPAEAEYAARRLRREAPEKKAALIGQTTLSPEEYRAVARGIRAALPDLLVIDTICRATRERQAALHELCQAVDAVVVVGGRKSANTRRLFARVTDKPAWLVEDEADIPPETARYPVIGLSAGASTPDCVIDRVEYALRRVAAHGSDRGA
jgi:4-hydroxy-3-methylbut-2-enyl diphosphate reductase